MPDDPRTGYPGLPKPMEAEHPLVATMRMVNPIARRISLAYAIILSAAIFPPYVPIPYGQLAILAAIGGIGWTVTVNWIKP